MFVENKTAVEMNHTIVRCLFLLIFCSTFGISGAETSPPISATSQTLNITSRYWKAPTPPLVLQIRNSNQAVRPLLAAVLSFFAAMISSAGGLGGGGLFIPILTIIAGHDVKTASTYSACMVTGGSMANVGSHLISRNGAKRLIDYDMALLCQPSLLLGVSCGVVLNVVFPEWLIMILFVVFVALCTFKTCKSGVLYWRSESRGSRVDDGREPEDGEGGGSAKAPLLGTSEEVDDGGSETQWVAIGMLVVIWISFFMLYLLRGKIEACGTGYWIISSMQIPLAVFFTSWVLFHGKGPKGNASTPQGIGHVSRSRPSSKLIFPIMALIAGLLGGVFGIGGGMLISPFLLQIGIDPQVTAATCSFMVLVSSSMSSFQYLLLGMNHIYGALTYAAICFVASLLGLTVIRRAILHHGRPSLIVFSVATVMALSVVLMTSFGALDFWNAYKSGQTMGFNKPC